MKSHSRAQILAALIVTALTGLASTAAAQAPRTIKIKGTDNMQFDVKSITAKAGEKLTVQLTVVSKMSKQEMAHNFVLVAKNTPLDMFVLEASMARATDYIPAGKKQFVLAATALAGAGETVEVTFEAPKEKGTYTYLCSFPGHYLAGMKGTLVVE